MELLLSNHYADCLAPCSQACPAGVDIQGYLSLTEKGLFQQAVELIKRLILYQPFADVYVSDPVKIIAEEH